MSLEKTDVVILCGGLGSRLKLAFSHLPKPMVAINGKPFLDILVNYMAASGFHRFIFCIGYKGNTIREHFQNYKKLEILFSEEKELLGTGGALKNSESFLKSDPFLVLNGDSFCQLDLISFLRFHIEQGGVASIALSKPNGRIDGGFIEIDKNSRVLAFNEKRSEEQTEYLNAGIYVFDRKFLDLIPSNRLCSLEYEIIPSILGKEVYGYVTHKAIYDIGTPERLDFFRGEWPYLSQQEIN